MGWIPPQPLRILLRVEHILGQHMWWQYINDNNFIHLGYGWNPKSWYFRYRLNGVYKINMVIADTLSINTWYHIAIVRTSNTFKLFRNGSQVGSNYSSI